MQHDAGNRETSTSTTANIGAAVPAATTSYHPQNGKPSITAAGEATVTREYDLLGRLVSYTDADGGTTVTEFDRFGKIAKVSDPFGSSTYTYDRTVEPRGLLTSVNDSTAGVFSAAYGPDENMIQLKYPGGVTRNDRLNANLGPIERSYTRDTDGEIVYTETIARNTAGQTVNKRVHRR